MSTFVGREKELQQLLGRFNQALGGGGGAVFITGEAGAGKSTLIEKFLIEATLKAPDTRVISTGCSEQYGAGEPYQPFVDAFRELVLQEPGKGKRSFGELARELAPYWIQAIPVAGDLIAATMATASELKQSMGQGGTATMAAPSEEAMFFQYTEVFLAATEQNPIILVIDDLHWADRASVSLLAHLTRKIEDRRSLIIGTYRPADIEVGRHPIKQAKLELQRYNVAEELALGSLDSSSLAELAAGVLEGRAAPDLLRLLEKRAGSNPLFFGELLRWLVEQGYAVPVDGEWTLKGSPEAIEIPRSVESVIEKRLDRLDSEVYRILEYASVEGDEFDSTVLARLLDMDELELEEQLDPIARLHKLIRLHDTRDLPDGEPTSIYRFAHGLIQDVLHAGLQGKRRILLHRKVAGILEEIYEQEKESIAHRLAIHFDEGRVRERAFEFAIQAAQRASRVHAHWDAIELLELGLRNAREDEQRAEAYELLGQENRFVGHFSEALENYRSALEAARSVDGARRRLRLNARVALVQRDKGDRPPEELAEVLQSLAQEAREADAREELCEILWNLSLVPGASREVVHEALATAQRTEDPDLTARAHYMVAQVLMYGPEPEEAIGHLEESLERASAQDDKVRMGRCHNVLGIIRVILGDYREAAQSFNAAAELFDEIKDPEQERSVRNNLGLLLIRLGEWERAEQNLQEAVRLAKRMGAAARLVHPLENLARLHEDRDEREAAVEHWQRLLRVAEETGHQSAEIVARCGLGRSHLLSEDLDAARKELEAARSRVSGEGWTEEHEDLEMLAARLAAAEGDTSEALDILERAESELESRDPYLASSYRLARAELLEKRDPATARTLAHYSLQVFERLGTHPKAEAVGDLFARLEDG